jgi:hypothetical protein
MKPNHFAQFLGLTSVLFVSAQAFASPEKRCTDRPIMPTAGETLTFNSETPLELKTHNDGTQSISGTIDGKSEQTLHLVTELTESERKLSNPLIRLRKGEQLEVLEPLSKDSTMYMTVRSKSGRKYYMDCLTGTSLSPCSRAFLEDKGFTAKNGKVGDLAFETSCEAVHILPVSGPATPKKKSGTLL